MPPMLLRILRIVIVLMIVAAVGTGGFLAAQRFMGNDAAPESAETPTEDMAREAMEETAPMEDRQAEEAMEAAPEEEQPREEWQPEESQEEPVLPWADHARRAIEANDAFICDELPETEGEATLRANCYFDYATGTRDAVWCDRTGFESGCYGVVATALQDPGICEQLFGQHLSRYGRDGTPSMSDVGNVFESIRSCYAQYRGAEGGDCEQIMFPEDDEKALECHPFLGNMRGWPSLDDCGGKEDMGERDRCHLWVGARDNEAEACRRIEDSSDRSERRSCMIVVGIGTRNADLCGELGDQGQREECLRDIARELRDPGICERIEDEGRRNECNEQSQPE